MASSYLSVNAWREIFARVFNDSDLQSNISPDWLINPATRRRLKTGLSVPVDRHRRALLPA